MHTPGNQEPYARRVPPLPDCTTSHTADFQARSLWPLCFSAYTLPLQSRTHSLTKPSYLSDIPTTLSQFPSINILTVDQNPSDPRCTFPIWAEQEGIWWKENNNQLSSLSIPTSSWDTPHLHISLSSLVVWVRQSSLTSHHCTHTHTTLGIFILLPSLPPNVPPHTHSTAHTPWQQPWVCPSTVPGIGFVHWWHSEGMEPSLVQLSLGLKDKVCLQPLCISWHLPHPDLLPDSVEKSWCWPSSVWWGQENGSLLIKAFNSEWAPAMCQDTYVLVSGIQRWLKVIAHLEKLTVEKR